MWPPYRVLFEWSHTKEQHGYTKTLQEYKSEKIQEFRRSGNDVDFSKCDSFGLILPQHPNMVGYFKECDYKSISKIFEKKNDLVNKLFQR